MASTVKFDIWQTTAGVNVPTSIQTLYATSVANQSIASTTPVAINGLSITITPKYSNSLIVIQGMITSSWTYVASMTIYRNGAPLIANHGGNNNSGSGPIGLFTFYDQGISSGSSSVTPLPALYVDTPGTTGSFTYQFYANAAWSGSASTMYINNRDNQDMLGTSWMTVTEIKQ